jgi:hypothetical protein
MSAAHDFLLQEQRWAQSLGGGKILAQANATAQSGIIG